MFNTVVSTSLVNSSTSFNTGVRKASNTTYPKLSIVNVDVANRYIMPVQNVAHRLHLNMWKPMNTLSQSKLSGISFLLLNVHLYVCFAMVLKKPEISIINTTIRDSISKFMYIIT